MGILIVGLGPGPKGYTTSQTVLALEKAEICYVQTALHPSIEIVKQASIGFISLDEEYQKAQDFDALNRAVAEKIVEAGRERRIVFAVTGEASQGQSAVQTVWNRAKELGIEVGILPGLSTAAAAMAEAGAPCEQGVQTHYEALDLLRLDCGKSQVICDLDQPIKASQYKVDLMELYPEDWQVALVWADAERMHHRWCPLYEMDRQPHFDATSCLVVPPLPFEKRKRYVYADLQKIAGILRAPDGCPWDAEQTHFSLKSAMLEEACEAIAAVDEGDMEHLCEELGDVLLQVAMNAEIAQEQMQFTPVDICSGICEKLIRRHPHVFGSVTVSGTGEVLKNREEIKKTEKGHTQEDSLLKGVGEGLPALMRAQKIQKKAKSIGFDWQAPEPAAGKVKEELAELLEALQEGPVRTEEEAGDLLFAAVNVVRLCGVHAETALMAACEKFTRRFHAMEQAAARSGMTLSGQTLETLDGLWEKAKRLEKQEKA